MTERVIVAYERHHSGHSAPKSTSVIYALPDPEPVSYEPEVTEEDIEDAALAVIEALNREAVRLDVNYKLIWKMIKKMMIRAEICDHIKGGLW